MTTPSFHEIWLADFEFSAPDGECPRPICLVAEELRSERRIELWEDDLSRARSCPFATSGGALFVAFYAVAELSCFLSLGWELPRFVLDLFAEFRVMTNGRALPAGAGLLGALTYFGVPGLDADHKGAMRDLALRGGPWSTSERASLLAYCAGDVTALRRLFDVMEPGIDFARAIHLRGRYMAAIARIERTGVPMDEPLFRAVRERWPEIRLHLIEQGGIPELFDGVRFQSSVWERIVCDLGIPWPRSANGRLSLSDETFRDFSSVHPIVGQVRDLRRCLAQLRLNDVAVGADGRTRAMTSAFRSRTGRNQPSTSSSIFSRPSWERSFIRPAVGRALAYVDWSQQEFGIAAVLSGDARMQEAYVSGDPYLAFAKQSNAVPPWATKSTHSEARERYKRFLLSIQYGATADGVAQRLCVAPQIARDLLRDHQRLYRKFWEWSESLTDAAQFAGFLQTEFGWPIHLEGPIRPRSLQNFPMQANGAEMLRIACILGTEAGVAICAPVHDAVLVEGAANEIEDVVELTQTCMIDASAAVLRGFCLRADAQIVRHPDRFLDPRGVPMWTRAMAAMRALDDGVAVAS